MRAAIFAVSVLVGLAACDSVGGGRMVIKGDGNSVATDITDAVAQALVELESTPEVGDEDLARLYGVVHEQALAGDLQAALVVLKIAEEQREPQDEDEP